MINDSESCFLFDIIKSYRCEESTDIYFCYWIPYNVNNLSLLQYLYRLSSPVLPVDNESNVVLLDVVKLYVLAYSFNIFTFSNFILTN